MNLHQEFEELTDAYELTPHEHFLMRCAFERGVRIGVTGYIKCKPDLSEELVAFEARTAQRALTGK